MTWLTSFIVKHKTWYGSDGVNRKPVAATAHLKLSSVCLTSKVWKLIYQHSHNDRPSFWVYSCGRNLIKLVFRYDQLLFFWTFNSEKKRWLVQNVSKACFLWTKGPFIVISDTSESHKHQFAQLIPSSWGVQGTMTQTRSRRVNIRSVHTLHTAFGIFNFKSSVLCSACSRKSHCEKSLDLDRRWHRSIPIWILLGSFEHVMTNQSALRSRKW